MTTQIYAERKVEKMSRKHQRELDEMTAKLNEVMAENARLQIEVVTDAGN